MFVDIRMDLLEGNTTYATNRGGGVEIQVNLTTLLDLDGRAAEIPGWGPNISDLARRVVDEQLHSPWRFVVNDPIGYELRSPALRAPSGATPSSSR